MSVLAKPAVQRVASAMTDAGITPDIKVLDAPCRTPAALAKAVDTDISSIICGELGLVGRRFVLAFIAGGRSLAVENLARALSMEGDGRAAAPEHVKAATGFPAGAIAPLGLVHPLPMVMDVALKKPEKLYFWAGDPLVYASLTPAELKQATKAIVSYNIAEDVS